MKTRPDDLGDDRLRTGLRAYGIEAASLAYAPVGFGDHHWTATGTDGRRWFLTLADLDHKSHCGPDPDAALAGLRAAMSTARALRGLGLLVAPSATPDGETALRLSARYALSVFPHTDGTPGGFADRLTSADRRLVLDALARLHTAAPPPGTPVHHPGLSDRPRLDAALAATATPWTGGPHAERARALTVAHLPDLHRALDRLDRTAATLTGPTVVTHGEPHPGNLLRHPDHVLLVDWDTVALATPERDLWLLAPTPDDLARYTAATGHPVDPGALAHYRLRWALEDVDAYLHWFRSPHADDTDSRDSWAAFSGTLAELPSLLD
ncbi:phosphotransferase [Kitasatospora sp. NPDC096147]|uniref:phosphotransferase n=1 Tax=Kitasatospora sp. NPDC096147 TaxID=3364093 RepID=UPI0037F583A2